MKQAFNGHSSLGDKQEGRFPEAQLTVHPHMLTWWKLPADSSEESTLVMAKGDQSIPESSAATIMWAGLCLWASPASDVCLLPCVCTASAVICPSCHVNPGDVGSTLCCAWLHRISHSPQPWRLKAPYPGAYVWERGKRFKKGRSSVYMGLCVHPTVKGGDLQSPHNYAVLLIAPDFPTHTAMVQQCIASPCVSRQAWVPASLQDRVDSEPGTILTLL